MCTYIYNIYLKYISDTFSKETTAQSLLHAVVELDRLLERVGLQYVDDRGEGLPLDDLGVGRQAGDDRRLDVVTGPFYPLPAELDRTASFHGLFDCRLQRETA